jgi:hypothetical protein
MLPSGAKVLPSTVYSRSPELLETINWARKISDEINRRKTGRTFDTLI